MVGSENWEGSLTHGTAGCSCCRVAVVLTSERMVSNFCVGFVVFAVVAWRNRRVVWGRRFCWCENVWSKLVGG